MFHMIQYRKKKKKKKKKKHLHLTIFKIVQALFTVTTVCRLLRVLRLPVQRVTVTTEYSPQLCIHQFEDHWIWPHPRDCLVLAEYERGKKKHIHFNSKGVCRVDKIQKVCMLVSSRPATLVYHKISINDKKISIFLKKSVWLKKI